MMIPYHKDAVIPLGCTLFKGNCLYLKSKENFYVEGGMYRGALNHT